MPQLRVAAVDFGLARHGLAVADELCLLAHPRPFIPARPAERALRLLARQLAEEGVTRVLVGLPLGLDGREGSSARAARAFAASLAEHTGLPVSLVDERLSTVEATARLREAGRDARAARSRVDSAAAAVLLQAWLDGGGSR